MKNTPLILALVGVAAAVPAQATEDVTALTTSLTTGTSSTSDGYTFDNSVRSVTSFSTATADYVVASLADKVSVQRNTVSATNSSVWYVNGNGINLAGVHQSAYDQMLLSNSIYQGSDNTFSNDAGATGGNIERLDFSWNTPLTASSGLRFGVFDRGAVGVHDSFAIAAILAVDGLGNPTAYGTLLKVAAGWGGTSNPYIDQSYRLFRYNTANDLSTSTASTETNTQGLGGILITTGDLGIADGTTIYGYSLMSNDVTDPLDVSSFPTNTDGQTGGGGIDLAAINGLEIQAVPEPTSMVMLALGLPLTAYVLRRKRSC